MTEQESRPQRKRIYSDLLIGMAAASLLVYAATGWLSWSFAKGVPKVERPTLWVLALFALAFVAYWASLLLVVRLRPSRSLLVGIVSAACAFRAVLLPSTPIHEIDIHRYIWDGAVLASGASPYSYAPEQVLEAVAKPTLIEGEVEEDSLRRLVALQARSDSLAHSLGRIHYGEFPSPYPIVSQAVFAAAAKLTPDTASPLVRLVIMKLLLVAFDLATMLVVIGLLRTLGKHPGLSLAYGWCPLVLKEFANSGHLDSIAIFFTTLAIWLLVKWSLAIQNRLRATATTLSAGALALGIGAKLYPVVLVPLFAIVWWKRGQWKSAALGLIVLTFCSAALLRPMIGSDNSKANFSKAGSVSQNPSHAASDPGAGVRVFLKRWEMNDLAFMVILENLRPQAEVEPHAKPWFVFIPDGWSTAVVSNFNATVIWLQNVIRPENPIDDSGSPGSPKAIRQGSFMLTRMITGLLTLAIAMGLALRATAKNAESGALCRAAMLTLAWFWLLCPTQNPWYWCWALPLLPFARYRTWYVVAACSLLYYLRFWFESHYAQPPPPGRTLLGTPYDGSSYFYFVVVWLEFGLVFLGLLTEWCLGSRRLKEDAC